MENPYTTTPCFGLQYDRFGMLLVGRNWQAAGSAEYRFGFNGKENNDEVYGDDNVLDFGGRIYDPRLGRWMSVDPLQKKYANVSPYFYTLDNPILYLDLGGRDVGVSIERDPSGCGGKITLSSTIYVTGLGTDEDINQYNTAFSDWAKSGKNVGLYVDPEGNEWTIEVQMEFVVATSEDIERIKTAGQEVAAENFMEVKDYVYNPFVGEMGGLAGPLPGDKVEGYPLNDHGYKDAANKWVYASRWIQLERYIDPMAAIHEVLHTYGLDDRYSVVSYEYTDEAGTTQRDEPTVKPHEGFETDLMGGDLKTAGMNQRHFNNIGSYILNAAKSLGDTFVMSRRVDTEDKSAVPLNFSENGTVYSNPQKE